MKITNRAIRRLELLFFVILFVLSTTLTIKQNQNRGICNWQSEIWADMAGYYIYLPATFYYHFDTKKTPPGIEEKTGYGFFIDHKNNKITTQYFYGVSFLISPSFLAAHEINVLSGKDEFGGFSMTYNKAFDIAAVFYLVLGLFFLKRFLSHYFTEYLQYFIILVTAAGTNLFFYSIVEPLMSHVYSFFAISLFLYAMKEFLINRTLYRYFLLMSFAYGIMFIIRPTNCLIGIFFLFLDSPDWEDIISRLKLIFQPKYIFPLLAIMFVLFFPQMIFWKIMHGSFIYLKYGVHFANWAHPKLLQVWFSTLNGLVPWSPVNLFFISGMFFMIFKRYSNGILIFLFFLLISYMVAACEDWYLGCGYGHRAFIEFMPVFCIPFGYLSQQIFKSKKRILQVLFILMVGFMVYFNAQLSLVADKCNFGSTWDWDYYMRQINRLNLFPQKGLPYTFRNDFENEEIYYGTKVTDSVRHSGTYSAIADPDHGICCSHSSMIWDFSGKYPEFIRVELLIKKTKPGPINAFLVSSFQKNGLIVNLQSLPVEPLPAATNSWLKVVRTFYVPRGLPGDSQMNFYVWNKEKNTFFVDDVKIKYQ
jgi:hypothetical protein